MKSSSQILGRDLNNMPVGKNGGRKSSDINGPKTNVLEKPSADLDNDGTPDVGVSQELSEDMNRLKR